MRILVTGADGFIGQSLVPVLNSLGMTVMKLTRSCHPSGILDKYLVESMVDGCDGIIHLAAISGVMDAEKNQLAAEHINVNGTEIIADAASQLQRPPWIIYISSREVYGPIKQLPVKEDNIKIPQNFYGLTKLKAERVLMNASKEKNMHVSILRLSNVYGSIHDKPSRVIQNFCLSAIRGDPITCNNPDSIYDFIHIQDVVAAILKVINFLEAKIPIPPMNICLGEGITLKELLNLVLRITQSKSVVNLSASQTPHMSKFVGSYQRAQQILNWEPSISLQAGIIFLIYYLKQLEKERSIS